MKTIMFTQTLNRNFQINRYPVLFAVICAIFCLVITPVAFAGMSPQVLLVDDFSDYVDDPYSELNNMKYWTGAGEGLVLDVDGTGGTYPAWHKITWQDAPHQWWATCLWDGLNPDTKTGR